jgi:hypothetical protein
MLIGQGIISGDDDTDSWSRSNGVMGWSYIVYSKL